MSDFSNEIVAVDSAPLDAGEILAAFNNPDAAFYSTIQGVDFNTRKAVLKAVTTSISIRDEHLGKPINLKDWIVQVISLTNEDGTVARVPRIVLIDDKGKAFHCISDGVSRSLQNIAVVMGDPKNWDSPLKIAVVEKSAGGTNRYMTIEVMD